VKPLNTRAGESHSRRRATAVAARVALCAACLTVAALNLRAADAAGTAAPPALRERDVRRAEKVVAKLRRLDEAAAAGDDARAYRALAAEFYPGLFVAVADMRESDLKTDLTTAVFLHGSAYRGWSASSTRTARCDREVRGAYLRLCLESRDGNPARLLLSKARLHTRWAEAVVRSYRGAADAVTAAELSELEAERKVDLMLAGRAVESLRRLGGRVESYSTLEAFEGAGRGGRLTFGQLSGEVSRELATVDQILASLPRGPLYLLLDNARGSYRDGLFWWEKSRGVQVRTVSANNLAAPDPLKVVGLSASTVNGTVLANWRHALRYTKEAEEAIAARKS